MTRTVRDAALMLNAIAGPDARDLSSLPGDGTDYLATLDRGIAGLRVAWTPDWGYAAVDPEVRRITEAAAKRFADAGGSVEEATPGFSDPGDPFVILFSGSVAARLADKLPEWRGPFHPRLGGGVQHGVRLAPGGHITPAHR